MTQYGIPVVNMVYPATSVAAIPDTTPIIHEVAMDHQQQQNNHNYVYPPQLQMHSINDQQHNQSSAAGGSNQVQHGHIQGQDIHYMDSAGNLELEQLVPQGGSGINNNIGNNSEMGSYAMPSDLGPGHHLIHQPGQMLNPALQQHRLEIIPYQFNQQQAHTLLESNMTPNQMNSNNSGEG